MVGAGRAAAQAGAICASTWAGRSAKRVDRPGVVPTNGELGIANREYVTDEDRRAVLDSEKLAQVKDPHVAMALRLEAVVPAPLAEEVAFEPLPIRAAPATTFGYQRGPATLA